MFALRPTLSFRPEDVQEALNRPGIFYENLVDDETQLLNISVLATSKSGTHWEPRDQGLDGGLVSSLRALL